MTRNLSADRLQPFARIGGVLHCEEVDLREAARAFGTPLYVYSRAGILERWHAYEAAFAGRPHRIHYAVKANSTLGILELLVEAGACFDVVSAGEILRVLAAGGQPERIVFSGVGKTRRDIALALLLGVGCINAESIPELERIERIAASLGRRAPVALRINPNVDAHVDEHVATGVGDSKFGIDIRDAFSVCRQLPQMRALELKGLSVHIGSQIRSVEPYRETVRILAPLVRQLEALGLMLEHLDLGGGAGVAYRASETTLEPQNLASALYAELDRELPELKARVDVEPGRSIVAAAGVLLTQVEFIKRGRFGRSFAVVDASMTELLRPALYGAYHKIEEVETPEGPREVFDVVGSVCESTDCLGHGRSLAVKEGTLLALRTAGAYGMSMASNYNSRPLPMEVLVSGNRMTPLRRRQTEADLFADELLAGEARADAGVLRATLFKAMDIAQKI